MNILAFFFLSGLLVHALGVLLQRLRRGMEIFADTDRGYLLQSNEEERINLLAMGSNRLDVNYISVTSSHASNHQMRRLRDVEATATPQQDNQILLMPSLDQTA